MYRADDEALVRRIAFRAARPLTVYRADAGAPVQQAADDTVMRQKHPVMLQKHPVMLQKYPVMLRAVAASRK